MTRTKKLKKADILLHILSFLLCFGLMLVYISICIARGGKGDVTMKEKLGTVIYCFGLSLIPMVVLLIVVGHRIKPTCWMVCVILANYLFGSVMMYVTFGCWFLDEYIITPLAKSKHSKYIINKEIDKRGIDITNGV